MFWNDRTKKCLLRLGNWLSNCSMYVWWRKWARFRANGQLIQTSPDICPIYQLLCSMENGLVGFLYCWGFLFWTETLSSLRDPWAVQAVFKPTPLVLNMLLDFWPISWTLFFGQLCGVNGSRKMCVIQGGIAAPLTLIKSKWDSF